MPQTMKFIQGTLAKGDVANSLTSLLRSNPGNKVTVLLRVMMSKIRRIIIYKRRC